MRVRPGLAALAAAAALGGALATAAPAAALDCAQFKTAMANASDGDVITLDQGQTCNDTYTLPSDKPAPFRVTIQGGGLFGATLDGVGKSSSIISSAPSVGNQLHVTIRNLTFRNGTATSGGGGGAISISGAGDVATAIDHSRFIHNSAPGGLGGAVHIVSVGGSTVSNSVFGDGTAAGANRADHSGAMELAATGSGARVSVSKNSFVRNVATFTGGAAGVRSEAGTASIADNTFSDNSASDAAGALQMTGAALEVMRNTFQRNQLHNTASSAGLGGAINAVSGAAGGTMTQRGNRFEGNKVTHGAQSEFSSRGGAESVRAYALSSRNDRFTGNSIQGALGSGEAEGGALAIEGCGSGSVASSVENAAIAANAGGAKTHGVGLYAGGCTGGPVDLTIVNSTIAANRASGAGATANLFGGADDKLTMRNSIVIRALGGAANMAGFGASRTVTSSDVCAPNKLAGAGNICAAAVLRDPDHGDIRQTVGSPTINRGVNAAIQGGPAHDFEGNKRILLGRVDMGADEYVDPFGGVGIPTQKAKIASKTRTVEVQVTCPAKVRGPCAGKLRLLRKGTQLGAGNFKIPRATTKPVTVSLTNQAVSDVKAAGTLPVVGRATSDDGFGTTADSSGNVTLKS